jgi:hypothetical protein
MMTPQEIMRLRDALVKIAADRDLEATELRRIAREAVTGPRPELTSRARREFAQ